MAMAYNLAEHVEELNELEPLSDGFLDQFQRDDGPLVVGLDADDEPIMRDGGGPGNLLILGKSEHKVRLESSILRALQIIRPECDPPHTVVNESDMNYEVFLNKGGPKKRKLMERAATQGIRVKETTNALRFYGPVALQLQVELAYATLIENREFLKKHDLDTVPAESMHTLHIEHMDRLLPQNDREHIYSMLGELAMNEAMDAGLNLIVSADDPAKVTRTLKENVIIISLAQKSQRASIALLGQRGMEIAEPHVGAIETRAGGVRAFRF